MVDKTKTCLRLLVHCCFLLHFATSHAGTPVIVTEEGVSVRVVLQERGNGKLLVSATYTPESPGWHLYDMDMNDMGIEGIGRPTRLKVTDPTLQSGPVVADQPVIQLDVPELGLTFPVYPDGPVTLSLPLQLADDVDEVNLLLSYMACSSDGGCRIPVKDSQLNITRSQ